jgi:hypothetical protein
VKTAPHPSGLTIEAYLPGHVGAGFSGVLPRCAPVSKRQGRISELRGTILVMQDRRRRPQSVAWLEANPIFGLTAPVLNRPCGFASVHSASFPSINSVSPDGIGQVPSRGSPAHGWAGCPEPRDGRSPGRVLADAVPSRPEGNELWTRFRSESYAPL